MEAETLDSTDQTNLAKDMETLHRGAEFAKKERISFKGGKGIKVAIES